MCFEFRYNVIIVYVMITHVVNPLIPFFNRWFSSWGCFLATARLRNRQAQDGVDGPHRATSKVHREFREVVSRSWVKLSSLPCFECLAAREWALAWVRQPIQISMKIDTIGNARGMVPGETIEEMRKAVNTS